MTKRSKRLVQIGLIGGEMRGMVSQIVVFKSINHLYLLCKYESEKQRFIKLSQSRTSEVIQNENLFAFKEFLCEQTGQIQDWPLKEDAISQGIFGEESEIDTMIQKNILDRSINKEKKEINYSQVQKNLMLPNINALRLIDVKFAYQKKVVYYLYEVESFFMDYESNSTISEKDKPKGNFFQRISHQQAAIYLEQANRRGRQNAKQLYTIKILNNSIRLRPDDPASHNNIGLYYFQIRDINKAIEALQRAATIAIKSASIMINLAMLFHFKKQGKRAIDVIEKAIATILTGQNIDKIFSAYGFLLFENQRYQDSLAAYQRSYELNKSNVSALIGIGASLASLQKFEEAKDALFKALKLQANAMAFCNLGNIFLQNDKKNEAFEFFKKALQIDPDQGSAYVGMSKIYYIQSIINDKNEKFIAKSNEYVDIAHSMIKKSQDKWCELYYLKAIIAISNRDYQRAFKFINKFKPGAISLSNMMFTVGNAFRMNNQQSLPIQYYKKAIQLDGSNSLALNNLANTILLFNSKEEACRLYQTAIKYNPNSAIINYNLGWLYLFISNLQGALACLSKAAHLNNSSFKEIMYPMGVCWLYKCKFQTARDYFVNGLKLYPNDAVIMNALAVTYIRMNRKNEAYQILQQAKKISPSDPCILNNIGNILYTTPGKRQQARNYYKSACELTKNCPYFANNVFAYNLANTCYEKGNIKEAIQICKSIVHINKPFADALNNIGQMLLKSGFFKFGISFIKKALEINPMYYQPFITLGIYTDMHDLKAETVSFIVKKAISGFQRLDLSYNFYLFFKFAKIEDELYKNLQKAFEKAFKMTSQLSQNDRQYIEFIIKRCIETTQLIKVLYPPEEMPELFPILGHLYKLLGNKQKSKYYFDFLLQNYKSESLFDTLTKIYEVELRYYAQNHQKLIIESILLQFFQKNKKAGMLCLTKFEARYPQLINRSQIEIHISNQKQFQLQRIKYFCYQIRRILNYKDISSANFQEHKDIDELLSMISMVYRLSIKSPQDKGDPLTNQTKGEILKEYSKRQISLFVNKLFKGNELTAKFTNESPFFALFQSIKKQENDIKVRLLKLAQMKASIQQINANMQAIFLQCWNSGYLQNQLIKFTYNALQLQLFDEAESDLSPKLAIVLNITKKSPQIFDESVYMKQIFSIFEDLQLNSEKSYMVGKFNQEKKESEQQEVGISNQKKDRFAFSFEKTEKQPNLNYLHIPYDFQKYVQENEPQEAEKDFNKKKIPNTILEKSLQKKSFLNLVFSHQQPFVKKENYQDIQQEKGLKSDQNDTYNQNNKLNENKEAIKQENENDEQIEKEELLKKMRIKNHPIMTSNDIQIENSDLITKGRIVKEFRLVHMLPPHHRFFEAMTYFSKINLAQYLSQIPTRYIVSAFKNSYGRKQIKKFYTFEVESGDAYFRSALDSFSKKKGYEYLCSFDRRDVFCWMICLAKCYVQLELLGIMSNEIDIGNTARLNQVFVFQVVSNAIQVRDNGYDSSKIAYCTSRDIIQYWLYAPKADSIITKIILQLFFKSADQGLIQAVIEFKRLFQEQKQDENYIIDRIIEKIHSNLRKNHFTEYEKHIEALVSCNTKSSLRKDSAQIRALIQKVKPSSNCFAEIIDGLYEIFSKGQESNDTNGLSEKAEDFHSFSNYLQTIRLSLTRSSSVFQNFPQYIQEMLLQKAWSLTNLLSLIKLSCTILLMNVDSQIIETPTQEPVKELTLTIRNDFTRLSGKEDLFEDYQLDKMIVFLISLSEIFEMLIVTGFFAPRIEYNMFAKRGERYIFTQIEDLLLLKMIGFYPESNIKARKFQQSLFEQSNEIISHILLLKDYDLCCKTIGKMDKSQHADLIDLKNRCASSEQILTAVELIMKCNLYNRFKQMVQQIFYCEQAYLIEEQSSLVEHLIQLINSQASWKEFNKVLVQISEICQDPYQQSMEEL